jgi:hypothetical protein
VEVHADGGTLRHEATFGQICQIPLTAGQTVRLTATPAKPFDLGEGPGKPIERETAAGELGVILDARGRPLVLPDDPATRVERLNEWNRSLSAYP